MLRKNIYCVYGPQS